MKRYIAWIAGLSLAGACLGGIGCSGGDVPDPEADAQAAGDTPPEIAPPSPPSPPSKPDEPVAARQEEPAPEPVEAATPATTAAAEPPPAAGDSTAKADPGSASATSEMLAIAAAPPSGDSEEAPAPGTPGGGPGASGAPGAFAMPPGMSGGSPGASMGPGAPGVMAAGPPGMIPPANGAMPAMPGGPGMGPGFPGAGANPGGPGEGMAIPGQGVDGAPGGSGKAADFSNPLSAVNAFLDALKQRDADLLAESTAFRSATESHVNNRKLFTSILEHTISDDDFDDLIEKLDGYTVSFMNTAKSTGRQGIVLEKRVDNHTYRRTIDVRREKAGWKVVDVGGERDLSASVSGVRSKPKKKR